MVDDFDRRLKAAAPWPRKRGKLYFETRDWGLGRLTSHIWVVPDNMGEWDPPATVGAEVYGVVGNNINKCGWIKHGPWVADAERVVEEIERERAEARERREKEEREREAAEQERRRALLDNYGKTPHPAPNP